MSDLFRSIRSTAGRAAFEAERIGRTASVQSVIKSLYEELNKALLQTGRVAFDLYQVDQIIQPTLKEACEQLAALQAQIIARERELEAIRLEIYEEPESKPRYGHLCPNGHGELPQENVFCHICGATAIDVAPPKKLQCTHCGAPLSPEARFCSGCGRFTRETPEEKPDERCAHCGATVSGDSIFCSECGQRLQPEEAGNDGGKA
jgi:DNA-directed RNA polymerase subunit RPC12/RpoP